MLVRNFTGSEWGKKTTSLEWIWSRKQMHRQKRSDSYLMGMLLCSWLSGNLKSSPKIFKCFWPPPWDATLKLYICTCSGKLFFSVRDLLRHVAEYFSVESEGVFSKPGQSDSFVFFMSETKPTKSWSSLLSLCLLLLCQPLCTLEWRSGSVTNRILFIFILQFHLKLFESDLNLNKISEN